MEQRVKPSFKHLLLSVLFGLFAALGAILPESLLLMPAVLGFVWVAWGGICCALSMAAAALSLLVCFGGVETLYALVVFVPASLCIGYCLRGKRPYRTAVVGASAAIAVGYYCLICLPSLLAGNGPFAAAEELFLTLADSFASAGTQLTQSGLIPEGTADTLVETVRALSLIAPELTCFSITALGMCFGLLDVVLVRLMARAAKVALKPMAPFPLWQLSKNYAIGAGVLLAGGLLALLLNLNNAGAVFTIAECVLLLPLLLMGVCLMEFLTHITGGNKVLRRVLFYASIVLLFPYSIIFLLILGVIDRISRLRRRFRPRDDQQQQ